MPAEEVLKRSRERLARYEAEQREMQLRERFGSIGPDGFAECGLPGDYVRRGELYSQAVTTLNTYKPQNESHQQALHLVEAFIETGGRVVPWLYLWSREPGLGKTHLLASALARHIREKEGRGRYARVTTFLDDVRPIDTRPAALRRYTVPQLLVLDDLGSERPTEASVALIAQLIDARYAAKKPTMLATNFSIADLANRLMMPESYGDEEVGAARIADRIFEMTGGSAKTGNIELTGTSWRKR